MQVLPPANGKKMWRVKRTASTGSAGSQALDSSRECLNNSLKISAAVKQFTMKRPPMKRPRTKSGQPKDFVFVDLSPIKSEDDTASVSPGSSNASSGSLDSPFQETRSPFSMMSDSFVSKCSDNDETIQNSLALYNFQAAMFDENALFGLGLTNFNYNHNDQNNLSMMAQNTFEYPRNFAFPQQQGQWQYNQQYQPQYVATQNYDITTIAYGDHQLASPFIASSTHRRTQSTSDISKNKSAGGIQFKTYKGPTSVKKPTTRKIKRTMSEPSQKIMEALSDFSRTELEFTTPSVEPELVFDYFLQILSNDFDLGIDGLDLTYSPITDFSDSENFNGLLEPINLDIFPSCEVEKLYKEEMDLSPFITI